MSPEIEKLARRTAARLAAELDPALPLALERTLAERAEGAEREPTRGLSFDPGTAIALAGLLLSAVQFGWTIWRDLKQDRREDRERIDTALVIPPRELLLRRLRLKVERPQEVGEAERDRLLAAVADEILRAEDAGR